MANSSEKKLGMGEPDLYEILGVPRNATSARIKEAYQELERIHEASTIHDDSDTYGELPEELQVNLDEVRSAYRTLSDESDRATYDDDLKRRFDEHQQSTSDNYVFGSVSKTSTIDAMLTREVSVFGSFFGLKVDRFSQMSLLVAVILPFILCALISIVIS